MLPLHHETVLEAYIASTRCKGMPYFEMSNSSRRFFSALALYTDTYILMTVSPKESEVFAPKSGEKMRQKGKQTRAKSFWKWHHFFRKPSQFPKRFGASFHLFLPRLFVEFRHHFLQSELWLCNLSYHESRRWGPSNCRDYGMETKIFAQY